jgi:aerobic-type carbon monoxide dehydrogenase small subunit (CoxS/CutS family)
VRIAVELNGAAVELEADAEEPLLAVLRRAGLASVRPTCGIGVCGACTVLVDDEPISSCLLLAPLAAGRRLTTLEGLRDDPVQAAFERLGAYQCGYCTPGMILTARALLAREPDPSPARIREALAGNLCRCGCYGRIVGAVRAAADEGPAC